MNKHDSFQFRHIGPQKAAQDKMLQALSLRSLDDLIEATVPKSIRIEKQLDLPAAATEAEALGELNEIAKMNKVARSFIGQGYSHCLVPSVIQRNILENPGWYTQYTPYQSEISQGRLEVLLGFQTLVSDLTGFPVSNASLLDEGTAAAEAMFMAFQFSNSGSADSKSNHFFVAANTYAQTIEVIKTRAEPLGIQVHVVAPEAMKWEMKPFGAYFQYPDSRGVCGDLPQWIRTAKQSNALVILGTDPLALTLLKSPAELGADIAIGSSQRLGVPMGFGGPHAAYLATRDEFKRIMPGRIIGVSKDATGKSGYRLALQTREQHIRREKATSNICTAQVLLAIMSTLYAVYHGPKGLRAIAEKIQGLAESFRNDLTQAGLKITAGQIFDTLTVACAPDQVKAIQKRLDEKLLTVFWRDASTFSMSLSETTTTKDLNDLFEAITGSKRPSSGVSPKIQPAWKRETEYLTHPVFNSHHSETEMLRYIRKLESRDLSLTRSMIPLGSCTMKLNATSELFPISWPEFANMHPFAPASHTQGYQKMLNQLEGWLAEITGFAATSLQPNAGSQGEYTGLLVIRKYHASRGQSYRNVCLIPKSAHGTNPATATLCGFKVIAVDCDTAGNVNLDDLRVKAKEHSKDLAALMVTYPSTHGVFEPGIREICQIVHEAGGQVYMDGANMNAQVGLCRPGDFGADVCHLNLHKTFCIPHGGGGPGMGPICVAKHLKEFLPGQSQGVGAVSAAPYGSASILPISWMYIRMMGPDGLKTATEVAILNANYIAKRLHPYFPVLYQGVNGRVAHECILDFRPIKVKSGVEVEDVAKRLMDYGFHAPTISFPVPGTVMIEPTESESLAELDRFCEAMISIHAEITEIADGKADMKNNLLKNAPHTAGVVTATEWSRPYSRERAAFPLEWVRESKFWPHVSRIDNVYGDRNLICTCPPME